MTLYNTVEQNATACERNAVRFILISDKMVVIWSEDAFRKPKPKTAGHPVFSQGLWRGMTAISPSQMKGFY